MDRFLEETAADLMRNFNRSRYGEEELFADTEALPMCEACGKRTSETLTYEPVFRLMECPACLESGLAIIASESAAVATCGNCGRTGRRLTYLADWSHMSCDDCAAEGEHVEEEIVRLSSPLCPEQATIMNTAETIGELANRLRAHELTECVACASTGKTVIEDRLHVNPAAICCEGEVA
jgi:hypothetical protein